MRDVAGKSKGIFDENPAVIVDEIPGDDLEVEVAVPMMRRNFGPRDQNLGFLG